MTPRPLMHTPTGLTLPNSNITQHCHCHLREASVELAGGCCTRGEVVCEVGTLTRGWVEQGDWGQEDGRQAGHRDYNTIWNNLDHSFSTAWHTDSSGGIHSHLPRAQKKTQNLQPSPPQEKLNPRKIEFHMIYDLYGYTSNHSLGMLGGAMLMRWWVWMNCWIWSNHTACTLLWRHTPRSHLPIWCGMAAWCSALRYSHTGTGERHTRQYSFEIWMEHPVDSKCRYLYVSPCISYVSINLNIIIIYFLLFTTESSSIHFDAIIEFTEFPARRLMWTCKNDPWLYIHPLTIDHQH